MFIKDLTIKKDLNEVIINNLSLSIKDGDKIAVIGEEGNGKSTLLKAILGKEYLPLEFSMVGTINLEDDIIGYLPQSLDEKWYNLTPLEYLLKEDIKDEILDYNLLSSIHEAGVKYNIDEGLIDKENTLKTLSGGEKVKLMLLKILSKPNTLLLLDEPTNDLDIDTLYFLENFIKEYDGKVLFVSHDENLIKNASNKILHLEQPNMKTKVKYTLYSGSYDDYIEERYRLNDRDISLNKKEREEYRKKQDKLNDIRNAVDHAQKIVSRSNPGAAKRLKKKMHVVKSMEKRYEKETFHEFDHLEESINVFFKPIKINPKKTILSLNLDKLKIENRLLIKDIDLLIKEGEKLSFVGPNGTGKSILIKRILKELEDRKDISVGYMPQNYDSFLDYEKSPIEILHTNGKKDDLSYTRELLGAMKFKRSEMVTKVKFLSQDQKGKILIIKLIKDENNVLILDEPTRNFSPLSSKIIRDIFKNFHGTIISVSHDRLYLNEVVDKIYKLSDKKLELLLNN